MTIGATSVAHLVSDVPAIKVGDRPAIVRIDGRSGVGRSTLAQAIAAETSATVIGATTSSPAGLTETSPTGGYTLDVLNGARSQRWEPSPRPNGWGPEGEAAPFVLGKGDRDQAWEGI